MSFRCAKCGEAIHHQSPTIRPTGRRRVEYRQRGYKVGREEVHDPGGIGWEITGEAKLCAVCAGLPLTEYNKPGYKLATANGRG